MKGKKIAFGAFQNVTALFDDRVTAIDGKCRAPDGYAVYAFSRTDGGTKRNLLAAWKKTRLPTTSLDRADVTIECDALALGGSNSKAHYVDLMDGRAYQLPASAMAINDAATGKLKITVPLGDWPALVADSALIEPALKR